MSRKISTIAIVVAVLILLIAAQLIFGGRVRDRQGAPAAPEAPAPAAVVPRETEPDRDAGSRDMAVERIELGGTEQEPDIVLVRDGGGWSLEAAPSVPVAAARVERLLDSLRHAGEEPAGEGEDPGRGYRVALAGADGTLLVWEVLLRPAGIYDRTLVTKPDGTRVVLGADLRGDLGLWENAPDARAEPGHWIDRRIFRFRPDEVAVVSAVYPDHLLEFSRSGPESEWKASGHLPGGAWSGDGLARWLERLASFQAGEYLGEAGPAGYEGDGPLANITLTLTSGEEKSLAVFPTHADDASVVSSDLPDARFRLPPWRYRKYFSLLEDIFPGAAPRYDFEAIRIIDVRRGGENVKLVRRDGAWRAAATPFRVRPERLDRLARYLAGWRPEDYATPGLNAVRAAYGGPMVEVTRSDGEVYQYRLAGRHPSMPWRYVVVNGDETFSIPDPEAALMFPSFADILDLGPVFVDLGKEDMEFILLRFPGNGAPGEEEWLELLREDGVWTAGRPGDRRPLGEEESRRLIDGLFRWRIAGFRDRDERAGESTLLCRIQFRTGAGGTHEMVVFQPPGRDLPYRLDAEGGYLLDRSDFFSWFATVQDILGEFAERDALAREAVVDEDPSRDSPPVTDDADDADGTDEAEDASGPAALSGTVATDQETVDDAPAAASGPGEDGIRGDDPQNGETTEDADTGAVHARETDPGEEPDAVPGEEAALGGSPSGEGSAEPAPAADGDEAPALAPLNGDATGSFFQPAAPEADDMDDPVEDLFSSVQLEDETGEEAEPFASEVTAPVTDGMDDPVEDLFSFIRLEEENGEPTLEGGLPGDAEAVGDEERAEDTPEDGGDPVAGMGGMEEEAVSEARLGED